MNETKVFTLYLFIYLLIPNKEKSGSYSSSHNSSTSGESMPTPFIPSDQAQKLINSYTEVARASFDQMNEISRRAQSIHHIASVNEINNTSTSLSDSGSNTSSESLEFNTRPNFSDDINVSTSSESALPKNYISSQS